MIVYSALETEEVRDLQAGGREAYGQVPERHISNGEGNPCRHCLRDIPQGTDMLILAHRPFPAPQPYAETGPIFLCAAECHRHDGRHLPDILQSSPEYLVKGYDRNDRIVYGTGAIVAAEDMARHAATLLARVDLAYLHIRSARNNCYQCRIDRAE